MKIKNKKKFIRGILIIFTIIFIILLIFSTVVSSHQETKYNIYSVETGDTLWSIACFQREHNDFYKDKDIRYIIKNIKEINNLSNSNLFINQELQIPSL